MDSRVRVSWMGAHCRGGIFLLLVYLWCTEGLDLLQCVAHVTRHLNGPWILRFQHCTCRAASVSWLDLAKGLVQASGQATCNGKEYDYFVVDRRLQHAAVAVVPVIGSGPHCPVRMLLRGRPRQHLVRVLVTPSKAAPNPPAGCLPLSAYEGWEQIVDISCPAAFHLEGLSSAYKTWVQRIEAQIADIQGVDGKARDKFTTIASGARLILHPALGRPCSNLPRTSQITVAWRTVAEWLLAIIRAFPADSSEAVRWKAQRSRWRLQHHSWERLGHGVHATRMRSRTHA